MGALVTPSVEEIRSNRSKQGGGDRSAGHDYRVLAAASIPETVERAGGPHQLPTFTSDQRCTIR
jgi:hypothetical protein